MKVLQDLNLLLNELKNVVVDKLSSDPVSHTSGRVWFNTTSGKLKYDDGTNINEIGTTPKEISITLLANGWSSNTQTISNADFLLGNYCYIVSPVSTSLLEYAECQVYASEVSTAGYMTFNCTTVPDNDLSVKIVRGGVV